MTSTRSRAEQFLVRWAIPQLHDIDALSRMVDPSLKGEYPAKSLSHFADIISRCVQVSALRWCFEQMDLNVTYTFLKCNMYFSNISIPYRVLKSTRNIHLLMCTMGFRFNVGCSMFLVRGNVSCIISLGIHSCPMLSCILWIFYFQWLHFGTGAPLRLPFELKDLHLTSSLP